MSRPPRPVFFSAAALLGVLAAWSGACLGSAQAAPSHARGSLVEAGSASPVPHADQEGGQGGRQSGKTRKQRRKAKKPAPPAPRQDPWDRRAGSCNVDVACPVGEPWRRDARAVVRIVAVNERCTGVLLNNTAEDGTPYVLTAAHCGDLRNATFYFDYLAEECGGEEPQTREHRLSGSVPIAVEELLDLQLVRLLETPPASFGVLYAGWDRTGTLPESIVTLHHPAGDVMKISLTEGPPRKVGSLFKVPHWDVGITERGSSGAPLFDPAHRVIGHLQGGAASCEHPGGDQFRRLEKDWGLVAPFLDPLGTDAATLDAFDPLEHAEHLAFRVDSSSPSPLPRGTTKLLVQGAGFSTQLRVLLDGTPLPRGAVRYRTNSVLELEVPAALEPGAHELRVVPPTGPDAASLELRVAE